ncbi:MAG: glycosyltransferase family 4 protein, partial [Kurthia sp.]|nr:glycosyltransferase family 4 protein [Candidatus Kurthia equi]
MENVIADRGGQQAYVFPFEVETQPWWDFFCKRHKTYTVKNSSDIGEMLAIIEDFSPSIIHTHFEGFDECCVKAVRKYGRKKIKIVWHMRDMFQYHHNLFKHLYQVFCFYRHYNWNVTEDVSIISVSAELYEFIRRYTTFFAKGVNHVEVIPNGVDFRRIDSDSLDKIQMHNIFTFLAYGSRNVQKRVDYLLKAANDIAACKEIKVIITLGVDTQEVVDSFFDGDVPKWCELIPQTPNLNELLSQADCFVSTSIHETFSNAICEASVYGLPVIQSDIEGTKWNANNPSTFVFRSGDVDDLKRVMYEVMHLQWNDLKQKCEITQLNNRKKYSMDA